MQTNKTFPVDPVLRRRAEDEVGKNSRSACLSEMDVRALCHELEVNQVELQLQNEELQRITAELAASEKKYRDLYEFAPIGYLTVEPSGKIREANLAAATLLGTERAHLLNNLFQAYLAEDSLSKFNAFCSRVIASDSKEIAEVHLRSNGTKERDNGWALIEGWAIPGSANHGFRMAVIDITERKEAEIPLQVAKEYAENLIQTANAIVIGLDMNRDITVFNQAAEKITGYSKAELKNRNWLDVIVPRDRNPGARSIFERLKYGDLPRNCESTILTKSGQERYIVWQNTLVRERDQIVGTVSFGIDITDRKLAEEALQKSERSYRLLAENVTDVIWTMDMDLKFTYLSPSIIRTIGYSVEEATKLTLDKLITPSSLSMIKQVFAEELEKERNPQKDLSRSRIIEAEEYCKDGRTIWVEVKVSFLRDQEGQAVGMQGISRDITDRKKAERDLIESEAKYRTIFENTGNAAVILEEDTTISLANAEAEKIFGYIATEVVGKRKWTEFIFKEDLQIMKKYHDLRRSDPLSVPRNYEFRLIDGLGKIRHIFMTIAMIPGTKQSVASLLDITERKTAEEKLKASLVEKELLLKEIHHRVKNNLQVVSSLLSLQSQSVTDKQTLDILQESQNRIRSMAMIHEKLYRSEDIAKINFTEYIRSLSANLIRSYEAVSGGVRLDLNVEDINLGLDAAIPCGLIINELVSNSLKHAFPAGCKSCKGEINIQFLRIDDNKFMLSVSDNGIGISKDKDFRQTESLGLQLVRILTDQLGGTIELSRRFGTEFKIIFSESERDRKYNGKDTGC
jgi:PAS domain S-box-containing protein